MATEDQGTDLELEVETQNSLVRNIKTECEDFRDI